MAKYKVLKLFRDKETKEVYQAGQEIEMTVKRADEAAESLKRWGGEFLERTDNKGDQKESEKQEGEKEKNDKGEG